MSIENAPPNSHTPPADHADHTDPAVAEAADPQATAPEAVADEPVDFSEPVRAEISSGWRWRPLVIGLGLLIWSGLCLKDALITYPEQIEAYQAVTAFKADNPDWVSTWPAFAEENGLPQNSNTIKERETFDVLTQWVMLAICAPIGLYCMYTWFAAGGRYVEADADGVRDNKGRGGTWSSIATVDDARWKTKGISKVTFNPGHTGSADTVVLDDWKFDRDATRAIHNRVVSAHSGTEQPDT